MTDSFAVPDAKSLVGRVLGLRYFRPLPAEEGGEIPIPAFYRPGDGALIVIVGENAAGRSASSGG